MTHPLSEQLRHIGVRSRQAFAKPILDAASELDRLHAIVERWWQPIATAPKEGVVVLVQHKDDLYPVSAYRLDENDEWRYETDGPEDVEIGDHRHMPLRHQPTHWMPLPEPPTE